MIENYLSHPQIIDDYPWPQERRVRLDDAVQGVNASIRRGAESCGNAAQVVLGLESAGDQPFQVRSRVTEQGGEAVLEIRVLGEWEIASWAEALEWLARQLRDGLTG